MIRDTSGFASVVDRAVAAEGHGEHGGWSITAHSRVVCICGDHLFQVEAAA